MNRTEQNVVLDSAWTDVISWQFGWRVLLWFTLLASGAWLSSLDHGAIAVGGLCVLGAAMAHGVELCHQALHHTGFRSRRVNEVLGVAMGLPMLVSFYEYRINHLKHHAFLGTPENREFFDYGAQTWAIKGLLLRFLMPHHYTATARNLLQFLRGRAIGRYHERYQKQVQAFYLLVVLALAALGLWCFAVSGIRPLLTWLGALLVASPIHASIEMPEHYGCDDQTTDVFRNTRTIRSNAFMRWFTNSNNYHVEHHRWPTVPIQRIHRLHAVCRERAAHVNEGYWEFYRLAWRGRRNRRLTEPGQES